MPTINYAEVVDGKFHVLSKFTKFVDVDDNSVFLGYIEGLASTPDLDRDIEIISEKALQEGPGQLLSNDSVFFNHQHLEVPLGRVVDAGYIKGKGLYVKVGISKNHPQIWQSIEEGSLKAFSISGEFLEWEHQEKTVNEKTTDVRVITKVSLYEVSVVGIPANPNAKFTPLITKYFNLSSATALVEDEKSTVQTKMKIKEEVIMPPDEVIDTTGDVVDTTVPDTTNELATRVDALTNTVEKSAEIATKTAEMFNKFLELQNKPAVIPEPVATPKTVTAPEIVPRETTPRQDHVPAKFENIRHYENFELMKFAQALLHPDAIKIDLYATRKPNYPNLPRLFKEDRK